MARVSLVFGLCLVLIEMGTSNPVKSSSGTNNHIFAKELFNAVSQERSEDENIIISPVSVQGAVGLAYFGAGGKTEQDLKTALKLEDSLSKQQIAESFGKLLKAAGKGEAHIHIANKMYVHEGSKITSNFNDVATKYFDSEAEVVNFADSEKTLKTINQWVEAKTNNKIKNSLKTVGEDVKFVIVNAIYFKGLWAEQFDLRSTEKRPFHSSPTKVIDVDTMYSEGEYKFGEIRELDASCLELPYKNSELSMLFVLPNRKDGLRDLKSKLQQIDINAISANLTEEKIEVFLPRFKIQFDLGLKDSLSSMGMGRMFSDDADFTALLEAKTSLRVDNVQHMAYIDVNEAGSEAAASTIVKLSLMSYNPDQPTFRADHPFLFFLKDKDAVYFMGQVISF